MPTFVDNLVRREKHEKLLIANTLFLIDYSARELREQANPFNKIAFSTLQADESGNVPIVFDKLTRNLYKGFMPGGGMPPMTEQVTIPAKAFVPPADRHLLKREVKEPFAIRQNATNQNMLLAEAKNEQSKQNIKSRKKYAR